MRLLAPMRLLLVALAVIACAWFALGARQAHDVAAATSIVSAGHMTAARAQQASKLLDAAGTLDPDSAVKILRSYVDVELGKLAVARRILLPVVRDEPQNIDAWFALARASQGDPAVANVAYSTLARLRPAVR